VALLWLQGCSKGPQSTTGRPKIAATIFPLQDIARNIAGDRFDVVGILPPGASPHTYAPSPRQVGELQSVALVFSIGHGLDDWTDTLVDMLPNARKIVVDDGVHLIKSGEHADAHDRHEGSNPHYWLAIGNGRRIARNIAEKIIKLDPTGEDYYRTNLEAYISKLDAAEQSIRKRIAGLATKKMLTFHDAWAYYADEFGLEIVGSIEPFPGKSPTPRYLAGLHEKAKEHDVTALFSEPQLSSETVASFTDDLGLKLYVLDPLGGAEGRNGYIELLEYNTGIIIEALSDG
jgi:ABC-type Zn uptake system ZnuABC Zn-binding protein ZnuA